MSSTREAHGPGSVDPRGARFGAWITTGVLIALLLTANTWLAAAQTLVFAIGTFAGLKFAPYSALFRAVVAPRLAPPAEREAAAPQRFAQGVGFVLAAVATAGFAVGANTFGLVVTAVTLGAVALNAVFGYCIGCEVYLRLPNTLRRHLRRAFAT